MEQVVSYKAEKNHTDKLFHSVKPRSGPHSPASSLAEDRGSDQSFPAVFVP